MPDPDAAFLADLGGDAVWLLTELDLLLAERSCAAHVRTDVLRFIEVAGSLPTTLRSFRADPHALVLLISLIQISRFAAGVVQLMPHLFWQMVQDEDWRKIWGRRQLARLLAEDLGRAGTAEHRLHALIRFNHYHLIRIVLGDATGNLPFEALVREIADLAEVTVDTALGLARATVAERYGEVPGSLVVLGFGKLGGRELNYSSDIDLVFVYDGESGAESLGGPRSTDLHDYFRRVGTELIRLLSAHHAQGQLYRVDMRLRPHGASGELVLSRREAIDYYYTVGRPWERQALIKARSIAGDRSLGERLLAELRPWIFPKTHGLGELDDARVMRQRIEERADEGNLKTGAGGIRDIEFLVQFFQLGFAGVQEELRVPATLPGLRALGRLGLLPREDELELARLYVWLRTVEHRLQMYEFRQLHHLPADAGERSQLAVRCGYLGAAPLRRFEEDLGAVRVAVRRLATKHYLQDQRDADRFLAALTSLEERPEQIVQLLAPYRFPDPVRAWQDIRRMAEERFFILSRNRTARHLSLLLPSLLAQLADAPEPQAALANFGRIVDAVGGRAEWFRLLVERPRLLGVLCDLAGWSSFVVELLTRSSGLPDELAEVMDEELHVALGDLETEGRAVLHGLQDPLPPLAFLHARGLALTAIADLQGAAPATVGFQLSRLAVAILRLVVERALAEGIAKWGEPGRADGRKARFAVLGLGKLGSHELSYASDMDVIFVGDHDAVCAGSGREADWLWEKTARRIAQLCQEGQLYPIDARLRPWGEKGPLVTSLATLREYWSGGRDLWERLAMTRVAPLAGDAELGLEAAALIRGAALTLPLPADAVAEVRAMRRRLEDSVAGRDHLKRGPGGYVDIEFAVQFLSLGRDPADLPAGGSTAETLRALARLGAVSPAALDECLLALDVLRRVENRMRLMDGKAVSSIPTEHEARQRFARCAEYPDRQAMDLELHVARERARRWYDALVR